MSDKRTTNRPGRGLDDAERSRILEQSRSFLRLNAGCGCTRKDLAAFVGVPPAIVSYYFPERADLIRAALEPIVADYRARLSLIDRSDLSQPDKLIAIICLLVECNMRDGPMIKAFYTVSVDGPQFTGSSFLRLVSPDTIDSIGQSVDDERKNYYGLDFIINSIWNVCESAAMEILSVTQAAEALGLPRSIGLQSDRVNRIAGQILQLPMGEQRTPNT